MEYWVNYLCEALIIGVFAVSLNVILGSAGQLAIAPAGFGAIGGYVAGDLGVAHNWSFIPALSVGTACALVGGLLLGLPALYLELNYLILLTLAFAIVAVDVIVALPFLGGTEGLLGIHAVDLGGLMTEPTQLIRLVALISAICLFLCWRLASSPFGRVLRGVRENEEAAQAVGKNTISFKLWAFVLTAGVMGVAGVALVYFDGLASSDLFSFSSTITMLAAVIVGGMGNLLGSFGGALVFTFLTPVLEKVVNLSPDIASTVQLIIFGALLVLIMRIRPVGLLPEGAKIVPASWRRSSPALGLAGATTGPGLAAAASGILGVPVDVRLRDRPQPPASDLASLGEAPNVNGVASGEESVVVAQDLAKYFGGIRAVDGLSLRLPEGKVTGLVGPNGAGKTTVFNLLTGRLPLDRGRVYLRGRDITGLPPCTVAGLGMVRTFQDVRTLLQLNCLDNVALGVPGQPGERLASLFLRPRDVTRGEREARERAMECLRFVGIENLAATRASDLSYGDQKLLAIARVLATGAEIILADEPASGIDRGNLGPVLDLIRRLRDEGKTICLVEHNLDVVDQLADHVFFMEQGRVTAEGTMEEIKADPRLEEVYFGHVHAGA